MKSSAPAHNIDLTVNNSLGALDKETSLIDTYIVQGVDALVVAPLSQEASIRSLRKAHDQGIPVITVDQRLKTDFPASTILSDPIGLGRTTGEAARAYIEEKLGGQARIAIIHYQALSPEFSGYRTQGFVDEVKKLPGVTIASEQDAWMAAEANDVAAAILVANPNINMIWAANEGGTVGAVTAVRAAGKAGQVVVFGTDMSEQIGQFLLADDNVLQAVTGQKPYDIGVMAIDTAVNVIHGEPVEKVVEMPGMLFTRERPDEVRAYVERLQQLSGGAAE